MINHRDHHCDDRTKLERTTKIAASVAPKLSITTVGFSGWASLQTSSWFLANILLMTVMMMMIFANISDGGDGVFLQRSLWGWKMPTWWGSRQDGHSWTQEHWNRMIMISTMPTKWFIKHLERCGVKKTPDMGPLKKVKKKQHLRWGQLGQKMSWTPRADLPSTCFEIVTSIITTNICSGWLS